MSRRVLCLLALLFVSDAILVHGRGPRPVTFGSTQVLEVVRLTRLVATPLA